MPTINSHCIDFKHTCRIIAFGVFLILALLPFTVSASNTDNLSEKQRLLAIEIEGVSLNTPANSIAAILTNHGYEQATSTTYTKQYQAPGQRRSIYRVEIEQSDTLHQINYLREKSGGRVKSPPKIEKPILENEAFMAREIYRIVCTEASVQTQNERFCEPMSVSSIRFNHGNPLQIDQYFDVLLDASAANTSIRLTFSGN